MKLKINLLIIVALSSIQLLGQEKPNIIPLSPNAASVAKYGSIPVSHFTGVPNISIPIYSIKSGSLKLPLALSYHAGGNKVESVASWVGLGWSLTSIPSISRSVRGIPDEVGGYFSDYSGHTIKELWDSRHQNPQQFMNFRRDLFSGNADSEPDIFYYNLPGESGKFFYNQESGEFITYPKTNTRISFNGTGFDLITQDGVQYSFNVIETTTSSSSVQGDPIKSTWFASTITSPSEEDRIRFTYKIENQIQKTKSVVNEYHFLSGVQNGLPSDNGSILTTNSIVAQVVDSIVFDNGYVKFNKNTSDYRNDLQGGYSLNNVSIYNSNDKLIKKFEFSYRFKVGNGFNGVGSACYNADNQSRNWMLLDKVDQVPALNSTDRLTHSFTYNETYFPACRYSAGQDYWGYYNGKDTNKNLTPTYNLPNSNTQISGADRSVDPNKSKFGIIEKITYPTGGYTIFEYENNDTNAGDLPQQYTSQQQIVSGDEFIDPEEILDGMDTYTKTFTLNNPPDSRLNGDNPNGGAFVDFEFHFPGCDLSSGNASNCARFTINGSSINITDITYYGKTMYLPNGTYTLTASFNQVQNPQYQNFIFIADWEIIDPNQDTNTFAGGLRIKEMKSYTVDPSSLPLIIRYRYTKEYNSNESSGDIFSIPNFSHSNKIEYHNGSNGHGGYTSSQLLRVRSTSNVQQVSHSGAPVGYSSVFEESSNTAETGYKSYHFTNARDEPQDSGFPYPPNQSFQLDRGELVKSVVFKKTATGFDSIQTNRMTYTSSTFDFATEYPKSSFAIKWGNLINSVDVTTMYAQTLSPYSVNGGWKAPLKETIINHSDSGNYFTSITNSYNNESHLLKTGTNFTSSDGKSIISVFKYPQDISNPTLAQQTLISQNRVTEVIESNVYKDLNKNRNADASELINVKRTDHKIWYPDVISSEFIKESKAGEDLVNKIIFHSYDTSGNLLEYSRPEGMSVVYLWGYNDQYPIAKIENATASAVSNALGISNLGDVTEAHMFLINGLRTSLSEAMVTTYTYEPLVGMTSLTDARGRTTHYGYDDASRLKAVFDSEQHLLKEYEYNYRTNN